MTRITVTGAGELARVLEDSRRRIKEATAEAVEKASIGVRAAIFGPMPHLIESYHRSKLSEVLGAAGFDQGMADTAVFMRSRPRFVDPRIDISIDLSGEYPALVMSAVVKEARKGCRMLSLMSSRDPRRRKRGQRMWNQMLGGRP